MSGTAERSRPEMWRRRQAGANRGRARVSAHVVPHDLDGVADRDRVGVAVDDVDDHARARALRAVELDDAGHVGHDVGEIGVRAGGARR